MSNTFKILFVVLAVLLLIYLFLPQPAYPPPLPNSLKSTEEGDTVQVHGVSAYFSQQDRKFVTKYYQEKFDKVPRMPLRFFSYRLNHPPQFSHEKIRDQIQSSYFEEVVHPLRESLFINGWEPEVFHRGNLGNIARYTMVVDGQKYFSKATLRPFYTAFPTRLINYFGILLSFAIVYFLVKRIIIGKS